MNRLAGEACLHAMRLLRRWGAILSMFAPAEPLAAQALPTTSAPEFVVHGWDTDAGLPQNTVNDIVQTRDGYLWLTTFGGLVRFDGVRFTVFRSVDHPGIGSDRGLAIAEDREGTLWIGTENGLIRYRRGTFTTFTRKDGLANEEILDILVDSRGRVWLSTATGLIRFDGQGFSSFGVKDGLPNAYVNIVVEDASGTLWVGTQRGNALLDPVTGRVRQPPLPLTASDILFPLKRDRAGALWFQTTNGVARWHNGTLTRYEDWPGTANPNFVSMAQDSEGNYWLASLTLGLWQLRPNGPEPGARQYASARGSRTYSARSVYVDREGVLWAGTNVEGLLTLRRRIFTMVPLAQVSPEVSPTAVLRDRRGQVWIGANCGWLNRLEAGQVSLFRTSEGRSVNCVWSIAETPDGALWFGTWGDGVFRLQDGQLRHYSTQAGLPDTVVLALYADRAGALWMGTSSRGLVHLLNGAITVYDTTAGLAHNSVRVILESGPGTTWVGTLGGLSSITQGRITSYTTGDGLSHNFVRAIHEDAEGVLWIGTYGGGLNRLKHGRFTAITTRNGLFDDVVSAILEDGRGNLWMSANRGIFRVSLRMLNDFAEGRIPAVHSVAYGKADGLLEPETNGGFQPAGWKSPDGRLWFPTLRGVAVVDPGAAVPNPAPPAVAIEELRIDGEPVPPADHVSVAPGVRRIEIAYTGLSTPAPEAVVFRYRLGGVEDDWVYVGSRRVAYFTKLQPGRYQFTVSAANRDGLWNERGPSLQLHVLAPWWMAWWFRLVGGTALVGAAAWLVRRRVQRLEQTQAAQREFSRLLIKGQEQERQRIAAELHDSIGQDLVVIKNRALLALKAAGTPERVRAELEQISEIISDTLNEAREIAHNLRPYQLDRLTFTAAIRAAVAKASESSDIRFVTEAGDVDGLLTPEAEINLYRIVQEALSNILKHSGATEAGVRVSAVRGQVRSEISDNGRGLKRVEDSQGFGIRSMAERARLLGGSLEISSQPGAGTTLVITTPVRGHARPARV